MAIKEAKIQSIGRAAVLLEAMQDGKWKSLKELSQIAGLARTTTFTLVNSLAAVDLVEHDRARGTYRLGLKHLSYGRAVERRLDLVRLARPFLVQLCEITGETVNLAIPQSMDALFVESLEGTKSVRVTNYSGQRAPYHATACGRAIMAYWDEARRRDFYDLVPRRKFTPHTKVAPEHLEEVLALCRSRGWTLEAEETELGASCVGAPLRISSGEVVAAVSVSGPTTRMDAAKVLQIVTALKHRLKALSLRLDRL